MSIRIVTVEFPEMHAGRDLTLIQQPRDIADTLSQHAIDQNDFAMRKPRRIDSRKIRVRHARRPVENAMMINVAVILVAIADLRVIGLASSAVTMAILEKARAGSPHKIDVAFDIAVGDIRLAVDLKRVLETVEIDVFENRAGVGRSVENDRLGLRSAARGGVANGQVG